MLCITREYRLLLRFGGNSLYHTHNEHLPPVPLAPFSFTVLGRLSSLQSIRDHATLTANIRSVAVKTALKKSQQAPQVSPNPSGIISAAAIERAAQKGKPRTAEELDLIARQAANPNWMPEMVANMEKYPDEPCRYIIVEDLLHPNSISRFHLIVKRVAVQQQQSTAMSTANVKLEAIVKGEPKSEAEEKKKAEEGVKSENSSSSASPAPHPTPAVGSSPASSSPVQYRYYVKDLGSLNGLYIDGVKIAHQQWNLLHEGARLRFAPQTRNAKNYIASFQQADAINEQRRRASGTNGPAPPLAVPTLPITPLSVKDMHIEYIFHHAMNEACERRVASLDTAPVKKGENEEQDTRPTAQSYTTHSKAAAAAGLSSDYHQNSAALARQQEADAANKAYYARFASHVMPAAAAGAMNDGEINVAPLPSNYKAESSNSAPRPKRARGDDDQPINASDEQTKRIRQQMEAAQSSSSSTVPMSSSSSAQMSSSSTVPMSSSSSSGPASSTSAVKCESDDEDMPLGVMRRSVSLTGVAASSASAQVAAASSSSAIAASSTSAFTPNPTSAQTATSAATTMSSVMEELVCSICSDVIYQFVVLG